MFKHIVKEKENLSIDLNILDERVLQKKQYFYESKIHILTFIWS